MSIARLPKPLQQAGFSVAALCPSEHYLAQTRFLQKHYSLPGNRHLWLPSLLYAIQSWSPELIIPADYGTTLYLQQLANDSGLLTPVSAPVRKLLKKSLGHAKYYDVLQNPRRLFDLSTMLNVQTPLTCLVTSRQQAFVMATQIGYPVVLKKGNGTLDGSNHVCRDEAELITAYESLTAADSADSGTLTDSVKKIFTNQNIPEMPALYLQQWHWGIPALHAFVALNGVKMAGITAVKECTHPQDTGIATVVRFMVHERMEENAEALVQKTGYSGFGCFDFTIEPRTGQAYLMDAHPYPSHISHLGGRMGHDLCAALFAKLTGPEKRPSLGHSSENIIALFPHELNRDIQSTYLQEYYHDIPWDDALLLQACPMSSSGLPAASPLPAMVSDE